MRVTGDRLGDLRLLSTSQFRRKLGGSVELVAPGGLPNDGKVIADERG
jgi:phenylacetate-CoA ligase